MQRRIHIGGGQRNTVVVLREQQIATQNAAMPSQAGRWRMHEAHTSRLPTRPQRKAQRVVERSQRKLYGLPPCPHRWHEHLLNYRHACGFMNVRAQAFVVQVQIAIEGIQCLTQCWLIAGQHAHHTKRGQSPRYRQPQTKRLLAR